MTPAALAAALRHVADVVEWHGLRVLAVSPDLERGGLTVQLPGGRLPDGCADVTMEDVNGHRHTTGMLDGVRVTECHELTAADFEVNRE